MRDTNIRISTIAVHREYLVDPDVARCAAAVNLIARFASVSWQSQDPGVIDVFVSDANRGIVEGILTQLGIWKGCA